ncbi:hypothetical protein ABPG74_003600 [Tetrahymena malaccensis]
MHTQSIIFSLESYNKYISKNNKLIIFPSHKNQKQHIQVFSSSQQLHLIKSLNLHVNISLFNLLHSITRKLFYFGILQNSTSSSSYFQNINSKIIFQNSKNLYFQLFQITLTISKLIIINEFLSICLNFSLRPQFLQIKDRISYLDMFILFFRDPFLNIQKHSFKVQFCFHKNIQR